MKLTRTSVLSAASLLIGGFIGASALVALADSTWTSAPAGGPTNNNVPAPINVGGGGDPLIYSQIKTGLLGLSNLIVNNLQVLTSEGTTSSTAGEVLTAKDNNGTVEWRPISGSSGSSCNSSPITLSGGSGSFTAQNTTGVNLAVEAVGSESASGNSILAIVAPTSALLSTSPVVAINSPASAGSAYSITFIVPAGYYYTISGQGNPITTIVAYPLCTGGSSSGVSQITAGNNITISPTTGTGNVTVNASNSGTVGGGCTPASSGHGIGYTCWGVATLSGTMRTCASGYHFITSGTDESDGDSYLCIAN